MSQSIEENFWDWFLTAKEQLKAVSSPSSAVLRELSSALQVIESDLSYELNHGQDGVAELVISANGIRELIPTVDSLVAAAPKIEGWTFTALRPRRELMGATLQCGDSILSTADVSFSLAVELQRVDVTLYLKDCSDEDYYQWLETIFLLMDAAIGERHVAQHVGEVFIKSSSEAPEQGNHPFTSFPEVFDKFLAEARNKRQELMSMETSQRRKQLLDEVKRRANSLAENLQEEAKSLESTGDAQDQLTVEIYYMQESPTSGAALVKELEATRGAIAEQLQLGSVDDNAHWVHAWFDISIDELDKIDSLAQDLAQQGYKLNCELSSIFVTWSEEVADISSLLASLDTLADAQLVMEAHQALDQDDPSRAVELLDEALAEDPENLEVRALLAYSYAKLRDNDMAEACLDELKEEVNLSNEHPAMFWNIACAYALMAEAQQACDNLRLAFELDPELRELAIKDPDLSTLRGQPEFDELLYQA